MLPPGGERLRHKKHLNMGPGLAVCTFAFHTKRSRRRPELVYSYCWTKAQKNGRIVSGHYISAKSNTWILCDPLYFWANNQPLPRDEKLSEPLENFRKMQVIIQKHSKYIHRIHFIEIKEHYIKTILLLYTLLLNKNIFVQKYKTSF